MKILPSSRRHHYVLSASVFLITLALIAGMAGCGGGGYNPPPSENLEIRTWYDLDDVRDNLAGNHTLMNDLDSNTAGYTELASPTANGGKGWEPIGFHPAASFTGSFDGQRYKIRDLHINRPDWCWVGLFGFIGEGGRIENMGLVNATVTGSLEVVWHGCDSSGSLVGANLGTVNNSYSIGSVTCKWNAGGLVGDNYGTVSNSYYSGNVTGNVSVGGLVGTNRGTVSNSYYNYNEVLINGENIITIGALFGEDFDAWLANDKFLDVNERLSQESGYYVISDVSDFKELLAFGQNATLKFRSKNDLDLAIEPNFYIPYLAGEFDGNGHRISNLSLNFGFVFHVGLFGYLAPGGKVTQVGVENVNITATSYVGGLVGISSGTVSNCHATGNVTAWGDGEYGGNYVGGLVGRSDGTVSDSYSSGSVSGEVDVGGLVGANYFGTVSNSYSTGSVTGNQNVGGVVGYNWMGTVINSHSTGNVTGASWVGGLVGYNYRGTISHSYSTGTITGGIITGAGGMGGVAGGNIGTVSNSYSTGSVTCDELVGGLVGFNGGDGIVSNSYSTGSVSGNSRVGGLVGDNWGTVSDSFWDTQTSGQATSAGGTGKNTTEMQDITTFLGAAWDIVEVGGSSDRNPAYIWNIINGLTYPFLSWQS